MRVHKKYGYLMLDNPRTQKEIDRYYKQTYFNPTPMYDPGRIARIISHFFEGPGRVLDVGCGEGALLDILASQGWEGIGVEPGPSFAQAARERGLTIIQDVLSGAMDKLGQYDLVVMSNLIEHLVDPERAIEQAFSLLRPGGMLYCAVPNDFSPLQTIAAREKNLRQWWISPDHLNYFSSGTLAELLRGKGLEIIYRTTDFPMELFLLLGWNYVDDPECGKDMHARRCKFEAAMDVELLDRLYEKLFWLGIGRIVIYCAMRPA